MKNTVVVDARGLSCPQPAMLVRQTLAKTPAGTVTVLVDSGTARDNVTRLAQKAGWRVSTEALAEGEFRLVLQK